MLHRSKGLIGLAVLLCLAASASAISTGETGTLAKVGADWLLPGDANRDGVVDVGDLAVVAFNWEQEIVRVADLSSQETPAWSQGDFDGSFTVDISDLGILAGNWGRTMPPPQAIPEPMTVLGALAGIGAAGGYLRRRTRRAG